MAGISVTVRARSLELGAVPVPIDRRLPVILRRISKVTDDLWTDALRGTCEQARVGKLLLPAVDSHGFLRAA